MQGKNANTQDATFCYPRTNDPTSLFGIGKSMGFLVHDTCLDVLKEVHLETVSSTRGFDLRDLLLFFKLHVKERDDEFFDWGYGDSFGAELRFERFDNWNPVQGSEVCHYHLTKILVSRESD